MIWKTVIPGVSSLFVGESFVCSVVKTAQGEFRIETRDGFIASYHPTRRAAQTAAMNLYKGVWVV